MAEISAQATSIYLELRRNGLVRQVVIISHILNQVSGSMGPEYSIRYAHREVSSANTRKQWQILESTKPDDSLYASVVNGPNDPVFGLSRTQMLASASSGLDFLKDRLVALKQEYTLQVPPLVIEVSPAEVLSFSRGSWPETYGSRLNRAREANDFGPLYR